METTIMGSIVTTMRIHVSSSWRLGGSWIISGVFEGFGA